MRTRSKQKYSKFGNTWPQQFINICITCVQITDDVNDRCCKLILTVQYGNKVDRRICSKWQIRNQI